jgi:hypothetical protein
MLRHFALAAKVGCELNNTTAHKAAIAMRAFDMGFPLRLNTMQRMGVAFKYPDFPSPVSELGQHRKIGTGRFRP